MEIDGLVLATIIGMALVTYATRAGGFWLLSRVQLPGRVERGLRFLPGAVLVALVVPDLVKTGLFGAVAALASILVAARTRNILLAMLTGVGLTVGLRQLFG